MSPETYKQIIDQTDAFLSKVNENETENFTGTPEEVQAKFAMFLGLDQSQISVKLEEDIGNDSGRYPRKSDHLRIYLNLDGLPKIQIVKLVSYKGPSQFSFDRQDAIYNMKRIIQDLKNGRISTTSE